MAHAIEPFTCRNGAFPTYDRFAPAEVVGARDENVHFRDDVEGCPAQESCIGKAYLVGGDRILTAHPEDGWTCAYFFGKRGAFAGWIPQKNVKVLPFPAEPSRKEWLGRWESIGGIDRIAIAPGPKGSLRIQGRAQWTGDEGVSGLEVVHVGEMNGTAAPSGTRMRVQDGESGCVVDLQLVGPYLLSTDNGRCGGANVRFSDVSRKTTGPLGGDR